MIFIFYDTYFIYLHQLKLALPVLLFSTKNIQILLHS